MFNANQETVDTTMFPDTENDTSPVDGSATSPSSSAEVVAETPLPTWARWKLEEFTSRAVPVFILGHAVTFMVPALHFLTPIILGMEVVNFIIDECIVRKYRVKR
ncbi:hypothetical protein ACWEO1_16820 [Kitasatospora cineracea]